jgi:hypothetical protein
MSVAWRVNLDGALSAHSDRRTEWIVIAATGTGHRRVVTELHLERCLPA